MVSPFARVLCGAIRRVDAASDVQNAVALQQEAVATIIALRRGGKGGKRRRPITHFDILIMVSILSGGTLRSRSPAVEGD